jgi:hypothetical protein
MPLTCPAGTHANADASDFVGAEHHAPPGCIAGGQSKTFSRLQALEMRPRTHALTPRAASSRSSMTNWGAPMTSSRRSSRRIPGQATDDAPGIKHHRQCLSPRST